MTGRRDKLTAQDRLPRAITPAGALLGESPVWDDRAERLLWVDLWGGTLHATEPDTGDTKTVEVAPPLSAVVPTTRGTSVVTAGLCVLELTEEGPRHLVDIPEDGCLRANDAAVDPAGRLWIGTMCLPGRPGQPGGLWRLEPGDAAPERVLGDVALANGIAWSPAGDRMYFVDSLRQLVTAFPFNAPDGSLGVGERFVEVPREAGLPDGIAVAADGSVWVALAGGGAVHRYGPDGGLEERLEMPVPHPTSCAFGGSQLGDLFVTSGCWPLPADQRPDAAAQGAGALFRAATGVTGLPATRTELG